MKTKNKKNKRRKQNEENYNYNDIIYAVMRGNQLAKKSNPLFDCLNAIYTKSKHYKYNKKDCNAYMLCMWLAHEPGLIDIVNDITPYVFDLPDGMIFKYFFHRVPKGKRYIKWTKKVKKFTPKQEKEIDKFIEDHEISRKEALCLLRI